ncbi:MAG TPA: PatB family C-S lyase [Cellvibrionaceae bacterium]
MDFDLIIDRTHSSSEKYAGRQRVFGRDDVMPLWVADMDFACPASVTQALIERANHPIYGYTQYPQEMTDVLIAWLDRRHSCSVQADWISFAPGVVPSLHAAALGLLNPDEALLIQPPVYPPFFYVAKNTSRPLLQNPLQQNNGRYSINFADLELKAQHAKLLILCSPHNPVGRVWQPDELRELLRVAKRHNLYVFSDEIHQDLIMPGYRHTMLLSFLDDPELGDFVASNTITAVAPSKTFNIPGMGLSALITPNFHLRKKLTQAFDLLHAGNFNPLSMSAFTAAYRNNDNWLDALMHYLASNQTLVADYISERSWPITFTEVEATYLLWLDCKKLGLNDSALRDFFIHKAGLGLNPGISFGAEGSGFMRLNIALPKEQLNMALEQLDQALNSRV